MGLMQGKVIGDTMIVMDAFALPVEGTETRVSAQDQAYEYMVAYMEKIKEVNTGKIWYACSSWLLHIV
jgi:COP9 signalosome complex subunit 5